MIWLRRESGAVCRGKRDRLAQARLGPKPQIHARLNRRRIDADVDRRAVDTEIDSVGSGKRARGRTARPREIGGAIGYGPDLRADGRNEE